MMEAVCARATQLLNKLEDYVRPSKQLEEGWVREIEAVYNFMKEEEKRLGLPSPINTLPQLQADGLDAEQIFQLVELQNQALLAAQDDLTNLDDTNLCVAVARLSSLAKHDKLSWPNEHLTEDEGIGGSPGHDELMNSSDESDDDDEQMYRESENMKDLRNDDNDGDDDGEKIPSDDINDEDEDENMDASDLEDYNDDDDDGLFGKPDDLNDVGLNEDFTNDTDDEVDDFDECIAMEGVESDDDDDDDGSINRTRKTANQKSDDKKGYNDDDDSKSGDDERKEDDSSGDDARMRSNTGRKEKSFGKTSVDTKFFKLRESEWVADNDAIGQNYSGSDDDEIDYMAEMSDGTEEEEGIMYDGFFDKPSEDDDRTNTPRTKLNEDEEKVDDNEEEEEDEEGDDRYDDEDAMTDTKLKNNEKEESDNVSSLLGLNKEVAKSTFEREREKELELMEQIEEENLSEKPWYLRGEVASIERPQNSTLEEHLEYDIAVRQKPIITEDTTSRVERIILGRVRIKAWDDVERKVRPTADPFEYKKKLLLDQDKSKKSLAEIYEEEYIKQQREQVEAEGEEEMSEHKDIRERMDSLFMKLDALSNYHYNPKQPVTEIKIKSNLPAITVEEATPVTVSDGTLLAPQEILEPTRGELVSATERSETDRKRERRVKKQRQRHRARAQEKKIQERVRQSGAKDGGARLDRSTTAKVIEKAVKSGQVKLLEGGEGRSFKSSQSFFKQLQDTTSTKQTPDKNKHKNSNAKKKKKKAERMTASKLLL